MILKKTIALLTLLQKKWVLCSQWLSDPQKKKLIVAMLLVLHQDYHLGQAEK